MKVRARIIDVRQESPQVVLQEIITKSHPVSCQYTFGKNEVIDVSSSDYQNSPLGRIHQHLIGAMATRLEDTVRSTY